MTHMAYGKIPSPHPISVLHELCVLFIPGFVGYRFLRLALPALLDAVEDKQYESNQEDAEYSAGDADLGTH